MQSLGWMKDRKKKKKQKTKVHVKQRASEAQVRRSPIQNPALDPDYMTGFFSGMSFERARRIWLRVCTGAFVVTGLYGIALGGHVERVSNGISSSTDQLAQDVGFRIEQIRIEGQQRVKPGDIARVLEADKVSLLSFDTKLARQRVEALPWVRRAQVLRLFPSMVKVTIEERTPYAIWQKDGKHYWIDTEGIQITEIKVSKIPNLPLIVGKGAAEAAKTLFSELKAYPNLRKRMGVAFRVAQRRWTLRLKNGVEIWLPETNTKHALREITKLEKKYKILAGHISQIDLRLSDRITLRKAGKSDFYKRKLKLGINSTGTHKRIL